MGGRTQGVRIRAVMSKRMGERIKNNRMRD